MLRKEEESYENDVEGRFGKKRRSMRRCSIMTSAVYIAARKASGVAIKTGWKMTQLNSESTLG